MGSFFRIAGMLWAALGVANIVLNPGWRTSNETMLSITLVFNVAVFVFPGLVILGIGELMYRKANKTVPTIVPILPETSDSQR